MKYLKYREPFLKSDQVDEALANDIPWGDSLLGRLINSVIRKAKIGYNLTKMETVVDRLKGEFDKLIAESVISGAGDDIKLKIEKIKISALLGTLKKSIDDGDDIKKIKRITSEAISNVESFKPTLPESEKMKSELLSNLQEFQKFLDEMDTDSEEKEEEKEKIDDYSKTDKMIENLKHLSKIIEISSSDEPTKIEKSEKPIPEVGKYYLCNIDNIVSVIFINGLKNDFNKKPLEKGFISASKYTNGRWVPQNPIKTETIFKEVSINGELLNDEDVKKAKLSKVPVLKVGENFFSKKSASKLESMIFESNDPEVEKFKKSISLLSKNQKGVSISKEFINDLINSFTSDPESKGKEGVLNTPKYILVNLYREIYSCIKGDRSKTIQGSELVSESFEDLRKDRSKISVAGELIARFYISSFQFEKSGKSKNPDLLKEISSFNSTLKGILESGMDLPDYRKKKEENVENPEEKKENILRYNRFLSINEADEVVTKDVEKSENPTSIKFYKTFNLEKWAISNEEIPVLERQLAKLEKGAKKVTINGMDPIMEVVKLFNRAYKLHTTSVIPSGRSGGKVSNKTFQEYTNMGGGGGTPESPGTGPWRNNVIFDKWESAVLDVLKDPKYRSIFNEGTVIKVGEGDERKNAGKMLLKFMNDMLDDNKLYKSGAQKEFIEKYFNIKVDEKGLGIGNDTKENNENSKNIKEKNLSFIEVNEIPDGKLFESNEDILRSFFCILFENEKGEKTRRYIWIHKITDNAVYFKYSNSFFTFNKYVRQVSGDINMDKGKMPAFNDKEKNDQGKLYDIYYSRMSIKDIPIKLGKKLSVISYNVTLSNKSNRPDDSKDKDPEKESLNLGQIRSIFTLVDDKEKPVKISADVAVKKGGQADGINHTDYINIIVKQ